MESPHTRRRGDSTTVMIVGALVLLAAIFLANRFLVPGAPPAPPEPGAGPRPAATQAASRRPRALPDNPTRAPASAPPSTAPTRIAIRPPPQPREVEPESSWTRPPPTEPDSDYSQDPGMPPLAPPPPTIRETPPIQVEVGETGVIVQAHQTSREVTYSTPEGPQTQVLDVEGYEIQVTGPRGYQRTSRHDASETVDMVGDASLPDGLYKYSITPKLRSIESLPGAPPPDAPTRTDANGRNAADPRVVAGRYIQPLEPTSGNFRIVDGSLVQPDLEEPPASSDRDGS